MERVVSPKARTGEAKGKNMKPKLFFETSKTVLDFSKSLRKEQTPSEKLLWSNLRNRNLKGYKFRRQHAIKSYIVDFFCSEKYRHRLDRPERADHGLSFH